MSYEIVMLHAAIGDRLGLSLTDHKYLDVIAREGPLTPGRLIELTGLTSGAVTVMVDRLERAGFVRRRPDPTDRRRVQIEVDEDSLAAIGMMMAPMGRRLAPIMAAYTEHERSVVVGFLSDLIDAVETTRHEVERDGSTGSRGA